MPDCKACGKWFATMEQCELCPTCERALERLRNYAAPVVHGRGEYIQQTLNTLSQLRGSFCGWWSLDPSIWCLQLLPQLRGKDGRR